jgi:hypothetical protein
VPCYECGRAALKDGTSAPLCADCRPTSAAPKAIPVGSDIPGRKPDHEPGLGASGWQAYVDGTWTGGGG